MKSPYSHLGGRKDSAPLNKKYIYIRKKNVRIFLRKFEDALSRNVLRVHVSAFHLQLYLLRCYVLPRRTIHLPFPSQRTWLISRPRHSTAKSEGVPSSRNLLRSSPPLPKHKAHVAARKSQPNQPPPLA